MYSYVVHTRCSSSSDNGLDLVPLSTTKRMLAMTTSPGALDENADADADTDANDDASAERGVRLTRDRVLAAALQLVDSEGLDALTMRAIGKRLGTGPMALYRYTPNRAALLDGVAEYVFRQLPPVKKDAPWQQQLRQTAHDLRRLACDHSNVVPLMVTRPPTPLGLRPRPMLRTLEQFIELLTQAGFAPVDALRAYRSFFGFVHGHILAELQELVTDPEETDDVLRFGLHNLPPREFPRLRQLAGALASYDGRAELDRGLDVLLTGLAKTLK